MTESLKSYSRLASVSEIVSFIGIYFAIDELVRLSSIGAEFLDFDTLVVGFVLACIGYVCRTFLLAFSDYSSLKVLNFIMRAIHTIIFVIGVILLVCNVVGLIVVLIAAAGNKKRM